MDFKIGDKCWIKQYPVIGGWFDLVTINSEYSPTDVEIKFSTGEVFTVDSKDIFKLLEIGTKVTVDGEEGIWELVNNYNDNIRPYRIKQGNYYIETKPDKVKEIEKHKCICPSYELFSFGCKCGGK